MRFCLALVQLPHQRSRPLRQFQEEDRIQAMGKGPQGAIPVAPSLCSFAGPSWRFRLGPQEMNLSAATLLSQSVETLPPPIPTCHSHDCKLADPRKLPGPSTSQRWYCLPSNQAHLRRLEPVIRVEVAQPFVVPPDLTWLYPNRPPTSTAVFRVY